jgi:hypothetical protein
MTDKPDSYAGFNEYNPLLDTDVSDIYFINIISFYKILYRV